MSASSLIKFLALLGLVGSSIWCYTEPSFEPALAICGSLITFIGAWIAGKSTDASQGQTVGSGGIGIQAGRDVKIGKIDKK